LFKEPPKEFLREALVWSHATHENVLPLLGAARLRDSVALISPWMEGGDLTTYEKITSDARPEELFADVARGLAYLHKQGIVYGNVRGVRIIPILRTATC
jgi:serine/threonine protein kinase